MSKEAKLQSQMVIKHSQERPNEKGLLWATLNRTLSQRDGQKQLAMGLQKGVSDLLYFRDDSLVAIEVKYPGERHSVNHIRNQFNWGKKIAENGGFYFIVTSVEAFWSIITGDFDENGIYTLDDIEKMIETEERTIYF